MQDSGEIVVLMMPAFKHRYKKLHHNQKTPVNKAIEVIKNNPLAGTQKKGDLKTVYVYKFDCVGQEFLLAYEFDPAMRILLALGVHENFYRDMKR
ncbi:MAG: type II toxin-antitoxin system RelE/ParE family toxin [Synergistaceae bacterium]|nr:type II toxin-antitoxin system RelE/ParE family toxin [Synergistaceae bacterium]